MYDYKSQSWETVGLPSYKGWEMTLSISPFHAKPRDYDCYDETQLAAWERDEWYFAELAVTASANGVDLGTASCVTLEYGDFPVLQEDGTYKVVTADVEYYKREYVDDVERLMIEAYDDAMERVRKILDHIEGKTE